MSDHVETHPETEPTLAPSFILSPVRETREGRELDHLLRRFGHEVRTPLNHVIGFSELMSLEALGPIGCERYRDYLRHIREGSLKVLKAAEASLAIASLIGSRSLPEAEGARRIRLSAAIYRLSEEAALSGIRLDLPRGFDDELDVVVEADPERLQRSLTLLLDVARAFSAPDANPGILEARVLECGNAVRVLIGAQRRIGQTLEAGLEAIEDDWRVELARMTMARDRGSLALIEGANGILVFSVEFNAHSQGDLFDTAGG